MKLANHGTVMASVPTSPHVCFSLKLGVCVDAAALFLEEPMLLYPVDQLFRLPCALLETHGRRSAGPFQYLQTQLTVSTKVGNIVISLGLHYSGVVKKKKECCICYRLDI